MMLPPDENYVHKASLDEAVLSILPLAIVSIVGHKPLIIVHTLLTLLMFTAWIQDHNIIQRLGSKEE